MKMLYNLIVMSVYNIMYKQNYIILKSIKVALFDLMTPFE